MKCRDATLMNRAIKDAFATLKVNTKAEGYHQTHSILLLAEMCWQRESNTPPPATAVNQPDQEGQTAEK